MTAYLVAMGIQAGIYALLALSLNLQWGYTGLLNFGVVGFFALGAYTYALTTVTLGMHPVIGLLTAIVTSALIAYPLGLVSIRLRTGFYLAIVTLGFGEVVRSVIVNEQWLTSGTRGIPISLLIPGSAPLTNQSFLLALVLAAILIIYFAFERLGHSPFGRTIEAIRDNEDAARSLGKPVAGFKIEIFMIGSAVAGAAGALNAVQVGYLVPDQFVPIITFYIWMAMIIGGSGSNRGVIFGCGLLVLFLEGSRFLKDILPAEYMLSDARMAALRFVVIGLALILVPIRWPRGIWGRKEL
ncbi:branched-chain amino acid ABC transporter permease [Ancylobacter sp. VNQ12]|uniref:branched-chain amino acid ABC transporter permease n=1 Tax=Ancylobacter sp. VNQ12 TaxID=3400920 RepID=UPI003C0750AA